MIELEKKDEFGPTDLETIETLEVQIGYKLPDDYKRFLLTTNGGAPVNRAIDVKENGENSEWLVRYFFGLHDGEFWASLKKAIDTLEGRKPKQFIPIANDYGGNNFLLDLSEKNFGKVSFWNHESEVEKGGNYYENIMPLFDSFSEFCSKLKEATPYDKEVKIIKKDGRIILD